MRGATIITHITPPLLKIFQSTPPMRGATIYIVFLAHPGKYFNPRPPCGERPYGYKKIKIKDGISIHAPHAGSDSLTVFIISLLKISIHAPHAGSDVFQSTHGRLITTFQSTPPMRGATRAEYKAMIDEKFQSTPPMRGATAKITYLQTNMYSYLCKITKNLSFLYSSMLYALHFP